MNTIYAMRTKNFCYVGNTTNIRLRKYWHRTSLNRGVHPHKEMSYEVAEYGKKCVSFELLEECHQSISYEREKFWIDKLSKTENVLNRINPIDNQWDKPQRSARVWKGKFFTEEHRKNISNALKGHKGRTLTSEESARMNALQKPHSEERRDMARRLGFTSGKPVIDLDTGQIFSSGRQAAFSIGTTQQSVNDVCHGKIKTIRGHRFAFHKPQ